MIINYTYNLTLLPLNVNQIHFYFVNALIFLIYLKKYQSANSFAAQNIFTSILTTFIFI